MAKKPLFTDEEANLPAPDTGERTRPLASNPDDAALTRPLSQPDEAAPASPRATGVDGHGHARPATRIHGYSEADAEAGQVPVGTEVAGWLVVMDGPGRGASVALGVGMNALGRGDDLNAQIDFGDANISREAHAFLTYDHEKRMFHISHGGKANVVRLNDDPVLTAMELTDRDKIRIGDTTLQFVAYCGPDFDWSDA